MHIGNFNIEDFKKKKVINFLGLNYESNVLNSLCSDLSHKIDVVKSIVLSVKMRESEYFMTDFHIKWSLECIGYAFSMPLDQNITIQQAISIYSNWLLVPSKRPSLILQSESLYQREMLGHMSLLFMPRDKNEVHPQLCAKVLSIMRSLIRKSMLKQENYPYLIKLLLLCFDSVLSQGNEVLTVIRGDISRVLFETFIRSEFREPELWTDMLKRFSSWITNTEVNLAWASVAVGLTARVVNVLYGEGGDGIEIEFKDEGLVSIQISSEHCVLAWNYFVVNVLENTLKEMFDPQTHKEFVRSVSKIVDVFISFAVARCEIDMFNLPKHLQTSTALERLTRECRESHLNYQQGDSKFPVPSIKSLVDLFGEWLFTQSRMNSGGTVYGHAEAVGTVCKIFNYFAGPAPDVYLGKFYQTLFKHFKYANESNFQVAGSILNHSVKLVTQDYRGVRILLHKSCIFRVLDNYIKSKDIPQQIKRDCYSIISAIIPSMKPYKKHGVISILNDCLLHAIGAESEIESLIALFWSICGYLMILDDQQVLENLLKALLKKLVSIFSSIDKSKFLDFLKVIGSVPFMVFSESLVSGTLVKEIVIKLILPTLGKNVKGNPDTTHFYCLNLLINWAMKFPAFLKESATRHQIFETFSILKNYERDKEYTSIIESNIFNYAGKIYPELRVNYSNTCFFTPCIWGNSLDKSAKHFLLKGETLLSAYNVEDAAILVIRNKVGEFIWKFKPLFGKEPEKRKIDLNFDIIRKPKSNRFLKSEAQKVGELIKDLSIGEVLNFEKLSRLFKNSSKTLNSFSPQDRVARTQAKKKVDNDSSHLRSLLSSLGFFQNDLIEELSILRGDAVETLIYELDSYSNKELYTVPLLYLNSPEASEHDLVVKKPSYPNDFICLINTCGLHLTRNSCNIGCSEKVLKTVEKFGGLVYSREYHFELAFLSPALFDTSSDLTLSDLLKLSDVVVLWNQRYVQPDSIKSPMVLRKSSFANKIVILLTPLRNSIVRVNIIRPENLADLSFGPLQDNSIVPIPMIGKFISMTIATASSGKTTKVVTSLAKTEIFKKLKGIASESEQPYQGKLSAVLSHIFKT